MIQRQQYTIRIWEKNGVLPKPLLRLDGTDYRWYSAAELIGYSEIFHSCKDAMRRTSTLKSGFPRKCAWFQAQLRGAVKKDPSAFKPKLPQEDSIRKMFMAKHGFALAATLSDIEES